MSIYAMGDLHFSGTPAAKPMEVFGTYWQGHREKILNAWQQTVQPADTVILCGDTSWAMGLDQAVQEDLQSLLSLPGQKVILKGNHDYWWTSLTKMQEATSGKLHFLQNTVFSTEGWGICGTRGWNLPWFPAFSEHDQTVYNREALRLEASLQAAQKEGCTDLIVALHYPPLYKETDSTVFTELCQKYQVKYCVYGHVHGEAAHALALFQGEKNGTKYNLVAADYLDFKLHKII